MLFRSSRSSSDPLPRLPHVHQRAREGPRSSRRSRPRTNARAGLQMPGGYSPLGISLLVLGCLFFVLLSDRVAQVDFLSTGKILNGAFFFAHRFRYRAQDIDFMLLYGTDEIAGSW